MRSLRNRELSENELFTPIAKHPLPRAAIGASICIHVLFAFLLAWIPLSVRLKAPERIVFVSPLLMTPKLLAPATRPMKAPQIVELQEPPRPSLKQLPAPPAPEKPLKHAPIAEPPTIPAVPRPEPQVETAAAEPKELPRAAAPAPKTGVFAEPSVVSPSRLPQRSVQIGGFGAPPQATSPRGDPDFVTKVGSFDAPMGNGQGQGTAGSRGAGRQVVATGGFGSAVAESGGRGGSVRGAEGGVRQGGFNDLASAAASPPSAHRVRRVEAQPSSVEILFKPRPDYTDEARTLGLEGDVILEVLFAASGQLRVLQVIRGLGHGLDEAAVRAAEQIRFKPALRDGKAVDARTTIRIIFRLA